MHERERTGKQSDVASAQPAVEHQEASSVHDRVLSLQATAGNQATTAFVQPLLRVGAAGDRWEQEAERVADAVTGGAPAPAPAPAPELVQRVASDDAGPGGGAVDGLTAGRIRGASSQGTLLPASVRRSIEPTLGADLSGVRVHTDDRSAALADSIGARAFTHGRDIFFAKGEYRPGSSGGLRTIAHEATHVVQQGGGRAAPEVQKLDNPLRALKKLKNRVMGKTNLVGDDDVKSQTTGGGGTANRVDKIKAKDKIGTSKHGFFKPRTDTAVSENAVASSRMARGLGMEDIIARNKFASINGEVGAVSGRAKGEQLRMMRHETPVPRNGRTDEEIQEGNLTGTKIKKDDGEWYDLSGFDFADVDLKNPTTQKGLADLQLFDAITGQHDRHAGNIFVDPDTGKVTGIDDDLSFSEGLGVKEVEEGGSKNLGLPTHVDVTTAEKVLSLKPGDLAKLLVRPGDPTPLADADIEKAKQRLIKVQAHVKKLADDGKLIETWDDSTYDAQKNEADVGKGSWAHAPNYLKRTDNELTRARNQEHGDRIKGAPINPPAPQQVQQAPQLPPKPLPPIPDRSTKPKLQPRPGGPKPLPPIPDRSTKPKLQPRKVANKQEALATLAQLGVVASTKAKERQGLDQ